MNDIPKNEDSAIGFELEHEPTPPPLPGTVILRKDLEDLASALLSELLIHAQNCVRTFGDFHLALSGGSTPMPVYMRLMTDPLYRAFPWKFTHIWIVDERRVPLSDDKANFKHIKEIIADHADMPVENVHPVLTGADDPAASYEQDLRQALAWREKGHDRLDYVLLGMGGDGHTASLFPNSPALDETARLVAPNDGDEVIPPPRITMTYPLINAARYVAILVAGEGKRDMLTRIATPERRDNESTRALPVLGVQPIGGVLKWFVDHAACPTD